MTVGLQIIIPGSDASQSGLGKMLSYPRGFSSDGLLGLYLFDEGVVGQPHSGVFRDSSRNNNHAERYLDFSPPVKNAGGIAVTDPLGFWMNTGIVQPSQFTVVACLKHTINVVGLGGTVSAPAWQSDTLNAPPASKIAPAAMSNRIVPGMRLGSNNTARFHGLRDGSTGAAQLGTLTQSFTETNGNSPANMSVIAYGINATAGKVFWAQRTSGYVFERTDTDIATAFAPEPGRQILLGLGPVGGFTPVTGEIVGFAVYGKYMRNAEWIAPAQAMANIAAARGVSLPVFGA
jgi:hypothetical protein